MPVHHLLLLLCLWTAASLPRTEDPAGSVGAGHPGPAESQAAPEDPLTFRSASHHHDHEAGTLTYFEYHAKRHAHVLVLDELPDGLLLNATCTLEYNATANALAVSRVALRLRAAQSAPPPDPQEPTRAPGPAPRESTPGPDRQARTGGPSPLGIVAGTILAGRGVCSYPGGAGPDDIRVRVTEVAVSAPVTDSAVVDVVLATAPAEFHECFEHTHLEYFHGKPHDFVAARQGREASWRQAGAPAPPSPFSTTDHILRTHPKRGGSSGGGSGSTGSDTDGQAGATRASRRPTSRAPSPDSGDASSGSSDRNGTVVETDNHTDSVHPSVNTSLLHRNATRSAPGRRESCWFGDDKDMAITILGRRCYEPLDTLDDTCLFKRDGKVALKAGNEYGFKWSSPGTAEDVKIIVMEEDPFNRDDTCADLSPTAWIPSAQTSLQTNRYTFRMPDLHRLDCADDFLSGFPEFYFKIQSKGECHYGKSGNFVLLYDFDYADTFALRPSNDI